MKLAKEPKEAPVEKKVRTFDLSSQVLEILGTPPNFHKVDSKHLFNNVYRVNVRVKSGLSNLVNVTKIAHSYFIFTDEEGNITKGDEITKQY
jgi:hypothetical protein